MNERLLIDSGRDPQEFPRVHQCTAVAEGHTRPVFKNGLCEFRSAHSAPQFLWLLVITGKNFSLLGQLELEVPDLDLPMSPTPLITPKIKVLKNHANMVVQTNVKVW